MCIGFTFFRTLCVPFHLSPHVSLKMENLNYFYLNIASFHSLYSLYLKFQLLTCWTWSCYPSRLLISLLYFLSFYLAQWVLYICHSIQYFIFGCAVVPPPYLQGYMFQDPQWILETIDSREPIYTAFFPIHKV